MRLDRKLLLDFTRRHTGFESKIPPKIHTTAASPESGAHAGLQSETLWEDQNWERRKKCGERRPETQSAFERSLSPPRHSSTQLACRCREDFQDHLLQRAPRLHRSSHTPPPLYHL